MTAAYIEVESNECITDNKIIEESNILKIKKLWAFSIEQRSFISAENDSISSFKLLPPEERVTNSSSIGDYRSITIARYLQLSSTFVPVTTLEAQS